QPDLRNGLQDGTVDAAAIHAVGGYGTLPYRTAHAPRPHVRAGDRGPDRIGPHRVGPHAEGRYTLSRDGHTAAPRGGTRTALQGLLPEFSVPVGEYLTQLFQWDTLPLGEPPQVRQGAQCVAHLFDVDAQRVGQLLEREKPRLE